jgi:beta-lactamase superfamily II metal-dependent hydrolase
MPILYILDIGHGNSSVLIDKDGIVVIDAGPKSGLLEFLLAKNITKVDILLLSHADQDHISGLLSLLSSKKVQCSRIYLNSDAGKKSKLWDDLVYALYDHDKQGKIYFETSLTPHLNGKLNQGDVSIEVLAPNKYIAAKSPGSNDRRGRKLTSNSISAVIRLSFNNRSVALLPGDIDSVGLDNLLDDHADVKAWLTVYPHHGGRSGDDDINKFSSRFCTSVQPEVVIFSIRDNAKYFPTKGVVEAVQKASDGVRMFTTRSSEVLVNHIKQTHSVKHRDCVGHIYVDFERNPLDVSFEC